jgi:hypothetical protein
MGMALAVDDFGDERVLYVADRDNSVIRLVDTWYP